MELISAKNGSAPRPDGAGAFAPLGAIGGGGGAGGARDIPGAGGAGGGGGAGGAAGAGAFKAGVAFGAGGGAEGNEGTDGAADDLLPPPSTGGGAPGNGGGAEGTGGAGDVGTGDGALFSNELIEPILLFFKWLDFLGRDGGILGGGLSELELEDGKGGAILGRGGAWFGKGGGAEGTGGLSAGGAGGADVVGLWLGLEGAAGAGAIFCVSRGPIVGILGAEGGTIPDRLSVLLTDLSLGIPPANMSPN